MNSENENKIGVSSAEDEIVSADVANAGEASVIAEREVAEKTGSEEEGAASAASAAEAPAGAVPEDEADTEETDIPSGEEENPETGGQAQPEAEQGGAPEMQTEISDADMRRIIADPMFVCFAKGKTQDIASLCRDFCTMLAQGENAMEKSNLSESVLARVTPGGGNYGAGVVLTERQRALARSAGMSYREYYDLISGIPEHTRKNNR
ncbi:MAG: hypothetical protein EGQ30_03440 [Clostridiales bacterium]|nr:hypothetical protein [Clostridiales bacterium]